MEDKFVSLAIGYNDKNEPIKALKVITLSESKAKEIIKQVSDYDKKIANDKDIQFNKELKKEIDNEAKEHKRCHILAYLMFNELVERGVYETTTEFETMFGNFLNGGIFDTKVAPKDYMKILERVL